MNYLLILQFCLAMIENARGKEKFGVMYESYIKLMHYKVRTILKQE